MEMNQLKAIKNSVIENIKKDMGDFGIPDHELNERIFVILDTQQFSDDDESVWLQKKGKAPKVCEVYFDGEFIADFHETDSHARFKFKYFRGFLKAYEAKKIRINRDMYIIDGEIEKQAKEDNKKAQNKAIESLPTTTPEEKISKEIVTEIIKEKENETLSPAAK